VNDAADVDRNVLDDPRSAGHDVDLLRSLHRTRVAERAADRSNARGCRAHDQARAARWSALLRFSCLRPWKRRSRGSGGPKHQDDGNREDDGFVGGQAAKK